MEANGKKLLLRRAKEKRARYDSHFEFLDKCISNTVIPQGFSFSKDVQIEMDSNLRYQCQKVRQESALRLMELIKYACDRKLLLLNRTISEMQSEVDKKKLQD